MSPAIQFECVAFIVPLNVRQCGQVARSAENGKYNTKKPFKSLVHILQVSTFL